MELLIESRWTLVVLFLVMLAMLETGRRLGQRRLQEEGEGATKGLGAMEGAVFGLLGLLVAFTFSGSAARFGARRELILQETNAIGTAWLRLDLLSAAAREELRGDFRRYVDLRLEATREGRQSADPAIAALQQSIWTKGVAGAQAAADPRVAALLLPALNEMFDTATARYLSSQTHPPAIIFITLLVLASLCAALAGYGMAGSKHRSWLHILCFAGSLLMAVYVILELEFPRRGLIRVDRYDQVLVELRDSMK